MGVRNPKTVRPPAERNAMQPGGHAGRRDISATINFGDKPAGCFPTASMRGMADRFAGGHPEAPRHGAYADDATFKLGGTN
jgi:hypothetical protein